MNYFKDQLVEETLENRMHALSQRSEVAALPWQHENYAGMNMRLHTAYGELEIVRLFGCFIVTRDGTSLVHVRSRCEAVFTRLSAAKAAGFVHLSDGFGDAATYEDDLCWDIRRPAAERPVAQTMDAPVDPSLPDAREWGRQRLEALLKGSVPTASAADENLLLDLEAVARSWQLPPPTWTKRAHGYYQLNTPYGLLVVRRLIGWTVERDGTSLVWAPAGKKVIFDKLEPAKTSALVHARDVGVSGFLDGTRWDEPADDQLSGKRGTPDQADGGNHFVVVR